MFRKNCIPWAGFQMTIIVITLSLAVSQVVAQQRRTFLSNADTWVDESAPSTNHGNSNYLANGRYSGYALDVLVNFPYQHVDVLLTARLYLYAASRTGNPLYIYASEVEQPWGEYTANWNNKPLHLPDYLDKTLISSTGQYYWWDVFTTVDRWNRGTSAIDGFYLYGGGGNDDRASFESRENSAYPPYLEIYYQTGVEESSSKTPNNRRIALDNPRPNPSHGTSSVSLNLPNFGSLRLFIYDAKGQHIRTLFSGVQSAGLHSMVWDGRDERGNRVPAGVYFYRLEAGGQSLTRKLVLLR